jgi:hypothetical protein
MDEETTEWDTLRREFVRVLFAAAVARHYQRLLNR